MQSVARTASQSKNSLRVPRAAYLSPPLSGWWSSANRRYAFRRSSSSTSGGTPAAFTSRHAHSLRSPHCPCCPPQPASSLRATTLRTQQRARTQDPVAAAFIALTLRHPSTALNHQQPRRQPARSPSLSALATRDILQYGVLEDRINGKSPAVCAILCRNVALTGRPVRPDKT